jgi:hypothetical protein
MMFTISSSNWDAFIDCCKGCQLLALRLSHCIPTTLSSHLQKFCIALNKFSNPKMDSVIKTQQPIGKSVVMWGLTCPKKSNPSTMLSWDFNP